MTITLRNGTTVDDPRLDRIVQFDQRSRNYPIREVTVKNPRSYTWRVDVPFLIDQGREGACVGFSVLNELQARPAEVRIGDAQQSNQYAVNLYYNAQRIDPWEGGAYPGASPFYDGTSVLAGVKVAQSLGYFTEYRWAFGIEDLVYGVGHNGPAVIGIAWYETNYNPDADGFIWRKGQKVGGHAVLVRAIKCVWLPEAVSTPLSERTFGQLDLDKSYVTVRNSWGVWGHNGSGDCYVTLRELSAWLQDQGEAVFMMHRTVKV